MNLTKIAALTKIFLKSSFQNSKILHTNNKKSKNGMKILYFLLFLYVAGVIGGICYGIISGLIQIQQETVFLGLFFVATAFLFIFQSIFSCMNVFYFSKDIEYVLPWPLSPKEILAAKFNVVLVTEYMMELVIGVIPLMLYGVLTGASVLYYIASIIVLIMFPILPILISAFFVMLIMSFAKLTKKRDSFQFFATILILVIVFGIQILAGNNQQEMTQEQMIQMLAQKNSLVTMFQNYFITILPTINALTNTNLLMVIGEILKIVGTTLIGYAVFILLGQKLYFKGVIGNLVGGKTKKKKVNVQREYRRQKIGISYVKKEVKTLIRNPIFFLQCAMPPILMPILFSIIFFFSTGAEVKVQLTTNITMTNSSVTIFIVLAIMQFFSMMTYITSATAISRDGLNATFAKYIPVPLYKQFRYKVIPNIILNSIATLIIEGVIYYLFPELSIVFLLAILVIQISINTILSYLSLLIDLKRPKLEWSTEYAVVKQNMNLAFPMIFGLIGILIMVVLAIILANMNWAITLVILFIVFTTIAVGLDQYVKKHQVTLFKKII